MTDEVSAAVVKEVNALGIKIEGLTQLMKGQEESTKLRLNHLEKDLWGEGSKGGLRGILGTQHVRIEHLEDHNAAEAEKMGNKGLLAWTVGLCMAIIGAMFLARFVFMHGAT